MEKAVHADKLEDGEEEGWRRCRPAGMRGITLVLKIQGMKPGNNVKPMCVSTHLLPHLLSTQEGLSGTPMCGESR